MPKKEEKKEIEEVLYILEFLDCKLFGAISSCATYCAIGQRSLRIIGETAPAAISYPNVGDSDELSLAIILSTGFLNLQIDREKKAMKIIIQKQKAQPDEKKKAVDIEKEMIDNFIQYFANEFEISKVKITSIDLNQSGTAKTGIKIENRNCAISNSESSEEEEE